MVCSIRIWQWLNSPLYYLQISILEGAGPLCELILALAWRRCALSLFLVTHSSLATKPVGRPQRGKDMHSRRCTLHWDLRPCLLLIHSSANVIDARLLVPQQAADWKEEDRRGLTVVLMWKILESARGRLGSQGRGRSSLCRLVYTKSTGQEGLQVKCSNPKG